MEHSSWQLELQQRGAGNLQCTRPGLACGFPLATCSAAHDQSHLNSGLHRLHLALDSPALWSEALLPVAAGGGGGLQELHLTYCPASVLAGLPALGGSLTQLSIWSLFRRGEGGGGGAEAGAGGGEGGGDAGGGARAALAAALHQLPLLERFHLCDGPGDESGMIRP